MKTLLLSVWLCLAVSVNAATDRENQQAFLEVIALAVDANATATEAIQKGTLNAEDKKTLAIKLAAVCIQYRKIDPMFLERIHPGLKDASRKMALAYQEMDSGVRLGDGEQYTKGARMLVEWAKYWQTDGEAIMEALREFEPKKSHVKPAALNLASFVPDRFQFEPSVFYIFGGGIVLLGIGALFQKRS